MSVTVEVVRNVNGNQVAIGRIRVIKTEGAADSINSKADLPENFEEVLEYASIIMTDIKEMSDDEFYENIDSLLNLLGFETECVDEGDVITVETI